MARPYLFDLVNISYVVELPDVDLAAMNMTLDAFHLTLPISDFHQQNATVLLVHAELTERVRYLRDGGKKG